MLYDEGIVTVDRDFARFGTKSYAIDKLTSIDTRSTLLRKAGSRSWLWLAVPAAILILSINPIGLTIGAVLGFFAYRSYKAGRDRPERRRYDLVLVTGAGETMAFQTEDGAQITRLRTAIERAMSGAAA